MNYLFLLLILAQAAIAACGSAEHQKEHNAALKKWADQKSRATDKYFRPEKVTPSPAADAVEGQTAPVETAAQPVAEQVPVVAPAAAATPTATVKGTLYVAAVVSWADAVNKAPAGKRVATRDELFALWDGGAFKSTQFSTGAVWTSSEKDTLDVWCLSTFDGSQASSLKSNALSTVYVDK